MNTKKIIYIVIGIVVIAIIAVALWFFFTRSQATPVGPTGTTGTLPQTGTQTIPGTGTTGTGSGTLSNGTTTSFGAGVKFGIVANDQVLSYFVDPENNVTVVEPSGKIASIANGQPSYLSSAEIQDMIAAGFSYDGTKIIVNFGDPSDPQTSVFDLATKSWTPLPSGIISPVWSPLDYRIAYLVQNAGGTESLATLDTSKASAKPVILFTANIQDFSIVWPNKNQIILNGRSSVYTKDSSLILNIPAKTLIPAVYEESGLETLWSNTTSSVALIFSAGIGGPGDTLSLFDSSTTNLQTMTFLTLPSKCAFSYQPTTASTTTPTSSSSSTSTPSSTVTSTSQAPTAFLALYCGIPIDPTELSIAQLPDSYDQLAFFTADAFYEINTETGAIQNIFSPTESIDASVLHVFNNTLFFVNRYDQKLYAISLSQ